MKKITKILLNALPILIMIALIPRVQNDYSLTLIYLGIIMLALFIRRDGYDLKIMFFGFVIMIVFEYIFVSTGVETFNRNTLLGLMPIWLPFLWSYGFVVIKRSVEILGH